MEIAMLDSNHKRVLIATLGEVEDRLMSLRRFLLKAEGKRLFVHVTDDFTQDEKEELIEKIECLMDRLIYLKNLFGLKPSERVLRWMARATAVHLSIQLEEIKSDRLKGYGDVPTEAKGILDPTLNEMISILRQLGSII
jgi:hypothetical protein